MSKSMLKMLQRTRLRAKLSILLLLIVVLSSGFTCQKKYPPTKAESSESTDASEATEQKTEPSDSEDAEKTEEPKPDK
jgi:hypothetical protein